MQTLSEPLVGNPGSEPGRESITAAEQMVSSWRTTEAITRRMSRQARRDTTPEMAIRSALHVRGCRFRVSYTVPGLQRSTIDVAFPRRRLAVFVDGCFWHGCPEHGTRPKSNAVRWAAKLDANTKRDRRIDAHLRDRGWAVVRIWEHEDVADACARVLASLSAVDAGSPHDDSR